MQTILQSAFLQALGYAIFNSLWQVALLWLIVMMINAVGKLSSSRKYFVGVVAQFAGFAWFIFTLQFYYSNYNSLLNVSSFTGIANDQLNIYEPTVNSFSSAVMFTIIKTEQLLPYLSAAYLFMLLFLSVRLTRAFFFAKQLRTTGLHKPGVDWRLFVKRTAESLGIKKTITIYFSEIAKSPLTIGFAKPLILVPIASLNHLTTDQLEAILLHELAHIKRADYLINIFQSVIETVLFFNPFIQLLGKLIKKERENSCDDWVLQFQYQPTMYAEALLRIACMQTQPAFAMNAAGGSKGELLPRVKRMLNQQEKTYQYRNQLFALLMITVMFTMVAWFNPTNNKTQTAQQNNSGKNIIVDPVVANVDNPFFNPVYFIAKPIQQKIDDAIAVAKDKTAQTSENINKSLTNLITKVTPVALQSLKDAELELSAPMPDVPDQAKQALTTLQSKIELGKIKINIDSATWANQFTDVLKSELSKIDWNSIQSEVDKATKEMKDAADEKTKKDLASVKIDEVMQQLNLKLKEFQNIKLFNSNQATQKEISDESQQLIEKQLMLKDEQQKTKERTQNREEKKQRNVILHTWSDIEAAPGNAVVNVATNNDYSYSVAPAATEVYTPVNYTGVTSVNTLDSAIIVVEHNPDNDSTHTKNIKVQVIGNNGVIKSYIFTVEVMQ